MVERMTTTARRAPAHSVLFANDEPELVEVVGSGLAAAHRNGAVVVIIARPGHVQRFEARLQAAGVDTGAARDAGSLVTLDADEALVRLTANGRFDHAAFRELVDDLLGLADPGRPIAAYGEIVDLLWDAGRVEEAIDLEAAWHEVLAEVPVTMMCGYSEALLQHAHPVDVAAVCGLHSTVLAEDRVERTWSFPAESTSATAARAAATTLLLARGLPSDTIADLQLIVAELVANALVHAGTPFSVTLEVSADRVVVQVGDDSLDLPVHREAAADASSGRGLQLLTTLSDRWGVETAGGSKVVWAELAR